MSLGGMRRPEQAVRCPKCRPHRRWTPQIDSVRLRYAEHLRKAGEASAEEPFRRELWPGTFESSVQQAYEIGLEVDGPDGNKYGTPENGWGIYEAGMAQLDDIVGAIMKKLRDEQ